MDVVQSVYLEVPGTRAKATACPQRSWIFQAFAVKKIHKVLTNPASQNAKTQLPFVNFGGLSWSSVLWIFVNNKADKPLTKLNYPFNDHTYISLW